jgi:hypothetical protein
MGDEDKIDLMVRYFKVWYDFQHPQSQWPQFDREHEYFIIRKGHAIHEQVSDAWDWFRAGWNAKEESDEV